MMLTTSRSRHFNVNYHSISDMKLNVLPIFGGLLTFHAALEPPTPLKFLFPRTEPLPG